MQQFSPRVAWLTVNRNCNFRCKWCYAQDTGYDQDDQMELSLALELVKLIDELGIKKTIIIGGEPTLWYGLLDLNNCLTRSKIDSVLVTNAYAFSNDVFWNKYMNSPSKMHSVSIKAGNKLQLTELTGVNNYEALKKGIVRIISSHYDYGISITYNEFLKDTFLEPIEFAIECGAKTLKLDFGHVYFLDKKPTNKFLLTPLEAVNHIVKTYPRVDKITNGKVVYEINLPFCLFPKEFLKMLIQKRQIISVCHVHKKRGLIFDTHGKLIICNGLFDFPIGQYKKDFNDTTSLIELLESVDIQNAYNKLGSYPSIKCIDCELYLQCGGGCPLNWSLYDPEKIITRREKDD